MLIISPENSKLTMLLLTVIPLQSSMKKRDECGSKFFTASLLEAAWIFRLANLSSPIIFIKSSCIYAICKDMQSLYFPLIANPVHKKLLLHIEPGLYLGLDWVVFFLQHLVIYHPSCSLIRNDVTGREKVCLYWVETGAYHIFSISREDVVEWFSKPDISSTASIVWPGDNLCNRFDIWI